MTLACSSLSSH